MSAAVSVAALNFIDKQVGLHKVESLDQLPREVRKQIKAEAKRIAHNDVFGVGHQVDKQGKPIEQGVGSNGNMTQQAIDAYVKNQTERNPNGPEPGYEEHLARMRKQLAACEAQRAAARPLDDDED